MIDSAQLYLRNAFAGVFNWFETWCDPFKPAPDADMPDDLRGFMAHFLNQMRAPFIAIMVLSGITGLIETGLYAGVGLVIDALRETDPAQVWAEQGWLLLTIAVIVLVLRTVTMGLSSIIGELTIVPAFFSMVRWQLHRRVLRQSYAYFQDDFAGRIATKVMQAGPSIGDFATNLIQGIWQFLIFGVVSIGLFLALDWRLGLILIVWFGAYFAALYVTLGEIRRRSKEQSQARAGVNGRIVDSYTNIQTVKLFAGDAHEDAFVREGIAYQIEKMHALGRYVSGLRVTLVALGGILIVASGWLGIALWQAGSLSLGGLAATLGLVLRLNHMSGWISFQINGLYRELGTIQDTIDTVVQDIAIVDRPGAGELTPAAGAVRFDHVTFSYRRGARAVHGFDLDIAPGEKVGLVGRSGAGKTTLVSLLLRLYDIDKGRILIDGQDISQVTQESLRRNIGMVTQDTSLLHRSIFDNIAYGRPEATRDEVIAAAKQAAAHDFVTGLSDIKGRTGYDAHVGERGVKLSGGQRQRIAIARVLLKNAPILVLDEATSALDSEVEAAIQEQLTNLMAGKTVIAIAHRLSTIAAMDRLVVMDNGRIVEQGDHDSLIAAGGLYADLWSRQSGGFLMDDAPAPPKAAAE